MSHVYNETGIVIVPRPYGLSDFLNNLTSTILWQIITNESIMSGNVSALTTFLLEQFLNKSNITLEELDEHPENASKIPGFTNDTETSKGGGFVFIGEDQAFNPNKDTRYWEGWNEITNFLLNHSSNRPFINWLVSQLKDQKQCLEVWGWHFSNYFKGLVLYDHNNNTYNEAHKPYYALPLIFINRTLGRSIVNETENYTIDYVLDQTWNESIESYNVIGQLNGTDTNNITVIGCLYDGFHNQATADAAIGMGIELAIAKHFNESHITPKNTIRFIAFSGEETGARGAFSYVYNHYKDNISLVIDLNQLGYTQPSPRQALWLTSNNEQLNATLQAIANDTDFTNRVQGATDLRTMNVDNSPFYFSDHTPFYKNGTHQIISFLKENTSLPILTWRLHHRDGLDHEQGDAMAYYDPLEVNATASLILNTTRYYTMNPNCWFTNVTYTAIDSPNDGDHLHDSIQANFTIHSILPSDKVRVEVDLGYDVNGTGGYVPSADHQNFIVNGGILNASLVVPIPDPDSQGNYSIDLTLYNSTGRINEIVYGYNTSFINDTSDSSAWYHLYHPLGTTTLGDNDQDLTDNITGTTFTAHECGYADNITRLHPTTETVTYPPGLPRMKCMIYRASDNHLIGTTEEHTGQADIFNFTDPKPVLTKNTTYILTCWADCQSGHLYSTTTTQQRGRYYSYSYGNGTPPTLATFTPSTQYCSLLCSYTAENSLPQIINISETPHTTCFGTNITINTNATDPDSGINTVTISLTTGPGSTSNYTMTHISGTHYRYTITAPWQTGQYNYTIWATDNATNTNSSTPQHFHVEAHAQLSIATLTNSYNGTDYIELTDPPTPPSNYTLVGRGLDWDKYYDAAQERNVLEISAGPVNYQNQTGDWTPITHTLTYLGAQHPAYPYGYRIGNDHGLYTCYFKPDIQANWPVAFAYNKSQDPTVSVVRTQLQAVGYLDPSQNWRHMVLQDIQSSQGQTDGNTITYPGAFLGTNVTYSYGNTMLKEEIRLSNTTKAFLQTHPPSAYGLSAGSYLVFITRLDAQSLSLHNGSMEITGNVTISQGGIDLRDALGRLACALPLGEAYEENQRENARSLTYRLLRENGGWYLLSGLPVSALNDMTFPVVVDPSITLYSSSSDGHISASSTSYNTAWTASQGTISDANTYFNIGQRKVSGVPGTYYVYRGFLYFDTGPLQMSAAIDTVTLSLYKYSDYSTTDFLVTVQNGQPIYPDDPLKATDYNKSHYSGDGGQFNTNGFTTGYNAITLNSTGLGWINQSGWTRLCLRSSRDISGTSPTGSEYIGVYSSEQGSGYQPKLVITYRNQSKLKNTGSTDIKGYLLIQVQYKDPKSGDWVVDNDTINETGPRMVEHNQQLPLDEIFNQHVRACDLTRGPGVYRVYTVFRNPVGGILVDSDGKTMMSSYQFDVT